MEHKKKYLIDVKWWEDTIAFMKQNKELNERLFQAMVVIQDVNNDRKKWREYAKKWEQHALDLEKRLEDQNKNPGVDPFKKGKTPTTEITPQTGGRFPTKTEAEILNRVAATAAAIAAKEAKQQIWEEITGFNYSGDLPDVRNVFQTSDVQNIIKQYTNDSKEKDTEYVDENILEKKTEP